jgi:aryl-alcohol dehydrogenase-like predicted oxidoreductase
MRTRELGTLPLHTSVLGLGCMGFSQGYGPADDDESIRTMRLAVELGVTLFDTAMSYGQGHNEDLVGKALAASGDAAQVATKFGIVRGAEGVRLDAAPERIAGYCEASLRRLGRDTIDLYYLHRVDPAVPIEDTIGAMAELVRQGKVRHLGVCEVTPDQLERAAAVHPITAVQFEYSLMWQQPAQDIIPPARNLGVGIVPYSPLGRGLLTGALTRDDVTSSVFRSSDPRFADDDFERNQQQVKVLAEIAAEAGCTTGQLALAWLLAQGDDIVPIPGTRRAGRMRENAAAADVVLDNGQLERINAALNDAAWSGDRSSFAVPVTTRSTPPVRAANRQAS